MRELARSGRLRGPGEAGGDRCRAPWSGRWVCTRQADRHGLGRDQSESTQPQQVVRGPHEQRVQFGARAAHEPTLAQAADRLRPAPDFLNQLPPALAQGIAAMAGGPAIEPGGAAAGEQRDVRADAPGPHLRNEAPRSAVPVAALTAKSTTSPCR